MQTYYFENKIENNFLNNKMIIENWKQFLEKQNVNFGKVQINN